MTRRDRCYVLGRRIAHATSKEAAVAWLLLAVKLELMGEMDVPKFNDLTQAIREAHLEAKHERPERYDGEIKRNPNSGRRASPRVRSVQQKIPEGGSPDAGSAQGAAELVV